MTTVEEALAEIDRLDDDRVLIGFDRDQVDRGPKRGSLAGEAIVVKDCIGVPGHNTTAGSPMLADHRVPTGSGIRRLLHEGAVVVATTSMHELAFGVTGRNEWRGTATNPAAPDRLPGGSSSGTAVAVASGVVDVGIATDTGGSARIPAACCGVIGFRPSTGRYPDDGLITLSESRDTLGVIARSLADVARFDRVLAAAVDRVPLTRVPATRVPVARVAVLDDATIETFEAEVADRYRSWIDGCLGRGLSVQTVDIGPLLALNDQASFPIALRETILNFVALAAEIGMSYSDFVAGLANEDVRDLMDMELPTADAHHHAATQVVPRMRDWYETVLATADLLAMPTMPVLPPLRSQHQEMMLHGRTVPTFPTMAMLTSPASLAGVPSLSIPIDGAGGPVSLLLEGRRGRDRELLGRAVDLFGHRLSNQAEGTRL